MILSGLRVNPLSSLGHQLDFHYVDDECDDLVGPGRIVALQNKHKYSGFIGPCCSCVRNKTETGNRNELRFGLSLYCASFQVCAVTAKLAAYWNIAMVSPVCADQQFLDKKVIHILTIVKQIVPKADSSHASVNFVFVLCSRCESRRFPP